MTDMFFRMVAPSFVMMTSLEREARPFPPGTNPFWIILSMPRGPKDVRMTSAMAFAARMFERRTSDGLDFVLKTPVDETALDIFTVQSQGLITPVRLEGGTWSKRGNSSSKYTIYLDI